MLLLSFDRCTIRGNVKRLMRILHYLCNYSANLNLLGTKKVIVLNKGKIESFSDKHKAEIMCLWHYWTIKNVHEIFHSEEKCYLRKIIPSWKTLRYTHTCTYTHTHRGIRNGKYMANINSLTFIISLKYNWLVKLKY